MFSGSPKGSVPVASPEGASGNSDCIRSQAEMATSECRHICLFLTMALMMVSSL
jgi:hypothetical protein